MARGGYAAEWQRALTAMSGAVVFTVIIAALYWARSVFIPITLAIFLAFVLTPLVSRVQRLGLGRTPAVILALALTLLFVGGGGAVVAQQLQRLATTVSEPERAAKFKAKIADAKASLAGSGDDHFSQLIDDLTKIISPRPTSGRPPMPVAIVSDSPPWMAQMEQYISPATEYLGQAAFAFILTVFMLLKKSDLRNRMIRLTGHGKVTTTTKAVDDASRRISKYLLMQLVVNTTFGVIITVGLFFMGVPLAPLWGAVATVMRYVPYIGTWIGLIPPTLFSAAMADGWGQPAGVLALFLGLEAVSNNFVEPKLYGQSMGLSEVAQLTAAGFWAFLWGPIGLILSGPLTVCLLVLGKHVSRYQYFEVLLGDEEVLEPRVALYQRLTAHDQDEASEIARKAARESDVVTAFDTVLVPALCIARRDLADGDLSAEDMRFVVRAMREVGEEVVAEQPPATGEPNAQRVRAMLCPGRDEVDHVGVDLLAHLIDPLKWEVEVAADETLASELLIRVEAFQPAVLVLGSIPPGGVSHTRYLVTRVRARFPELKIVIGRWGRGEDVIEEADTAGIPGADWTDTTLAETRKRLLERYSVFTATAADNNSQPAPGKSRAVGTPAAKK